MGSAAGRRAISSAGGQPNIWDCGKAVVAGCADEEGDIVALIGGPRSGASEVKGFVTGRAI